MLSPVLKYTIDPKIDCFPEQPPAKLVGGTLHTIDPKLDCFPEQPPAKLVGGTLHTQRSNAHGAAGDICDQIMIPPKHPVLQ